MNPQIPSELLMPESQVCGCSYCESARMQLCDAREALGKADAQMNEALQAWRLYMDMAQDASDAHQGPLA